MRTIGRKWPTEAPRGDFQVICDYCGVQWRRSQCLRGADGLLRCPLDRDGRDEVELARGNAMAATRRYRPRPQTDGGGYDTTPQEEPPVVAPMGKPGSTF